jgi:hypothetical protein
MTTTNISGTWSEKQRPNCGLDRVADYVHENRLTRVPVVGYIEFHQFTERVNGASLTVSIPAIEPGMDANGEDPDGLGAQLWAILDQLRNRQRKGAVADTLFSVPQSELHRGDDDEEFPGQTALPIGERVVPEASAAEIMAERAEAAAANTAEARRAEIKAAKSGPSAATVKAVTGKAPEAAFTAPTGGDPA